MVKAWWICPASQHPCPCVPHSSALLPSHWLTSSNASHQVQLHKIPQMPLPKHSFQSLCYVRGRTSSNFAYIEWIQKIPSQHEPCPFSDSGCKSPPFLLPGVASGWAKKEEGLTAPQLLLFFALPCTGPRCLPSLCFLPFLLPRRNVVQGGCHSQASSAGSTQQLPLAMAGAGPGHNASSGCFATEA